MPANPRCCLPDSGCCMGTGCSADDCCTTTQCCGATSTLSCNMSMACTGPAEGCHLVFADCCSTGGGGPDAGCSYGPDWDECTPPNGNGGGGGG